MRNINDSWVMIFAAILAIAIGGCNSDERVAQVATEAANRQAQQNTEMAKVTNQVAEGSRELVEADSEARREIVKVHQELQAERSRLGEQWNQLEGERQEIAQDRRTESMLVPAIQAVGAIAVAILAIGFCLSLLFGLRKNNEADAILGELLIHEIIAEEPRLLTKQHIRALPGSDDCCPGLDPPSLGGNRSDPEPPSQ